MNDVKQSQVLFLLVVETCPNEKFVCQTVTTKWTTPLTITFIDLICFLTLSKIACKQFYLKGKVGKVPYRRKL